MIQITQLKLKIDHNQDQFIDKICKILRVKQCDIQNTVIRKQSLDARRKLELFYIYTVDVQVANERKVLNKCRSKNVSLSNWTTYSVPPAGKTALSNRPVVVGSGPAGLFCSYMLSLHGYKPILIERGSSVEKRIKDVEEFWKTGKLNPHSNVQFGEGGAGTFSDGKLNTLVKDPMGRNHKVLEIFTEHGAPEEITYSHKPHIGTDLLVNIVKSMRETVIAHGGTVLFDHQVTGFKSDENGNLVSLFVERLSDHTVLTFETEVAVFAIGHSARDTFYMLSDSNVPMEPKAFAVGVRVEHLQTMIDQSQYGQQQNEHLSAAAYKLTANLENGRGVYTFCMCPGGYVVNASSEDHRLAVNGMSYSDRAGKNANSAVIVTVRPEDFDKQGPLSGIHFQRDLEERAYHLGNGKIPVQLFGDFRKNKTSTSLGSVTPQMKGEWCFANVRSIFPEALSTSLEEGILAFDHKIKGYAQDDCIISGVESRTSSPVRILRDKTMQSEVRGFYPCGEGAGYAGGITSAAIDGLKVFEAIRSTYRPFD